MTGKNLIEQWVSDHYSLNVRADYLSGYEEENFKLTTPSGQKFILKACSDGTQKSALEGQTALLEYLSATPLTSYFPKVIRNGKGESVTVVQNDRQSYRLRIYEFMEGKFWHEQQVFPDNLLENTGSFLGRMDRTLADFDHPGLHRNIIWDLNKATAGRDHLKYIDDPAKRRLADYFLLQYETEVLPALPILRHACIHNDANDYNLLVRNQKISGLIDFGDAVYSALINNLSIACTYAAMYMKDPLAAIPLMVRGYHRENPLQKEEIKLLYYLIATRLFISVTQSARQATEDSSNEHHFLSEKPAWELLEKWIRINPLKAEKYFLNICGFGTSTNSENRAGLLEGRHRHISRSLSLSYEDPLRIVKGALQYLYDDRGHTFLDCVNNVSHVGHCHPAVVRTMQKQIATLNTNTRYLHDHLVNYASALTSTLPDPLRICFFTNSGSEANDLAVRIARLYTKKNDVIVLDHAYHGTTTLTLEMSPYKFDSKGGSGQKKYIHKAESPDLYRGEWGYSDRNAASAYAKSVTAILQNLEDSQSGAAAFICESLFGVGGQIPLPKGYLQEVYAIVRRHGGVCIADEVQVGFGRVGEKFWGFELQDVVPDIVVLGKPIGNGHPLAAVVITEEIAAAFDNGLEYFNTFGGNPVSMATGLSVLEVIEDERLQKNALDVGNFLLQEFRHLMDRHLLIGDVRGHGLFIGVELVKDRMTKTPAQSEIRTIIEKMKNRGFLLSSDGPLHNVLKIKPPIIFDKRNASDLVKNLDEVLEGL